MTSEEGEVDVIMLGWERCTECTLVHPICNSLIMNIFHKT